MKKIKCFSVFMLKNCTYSCRQIGILHILNNFYCSQTLISMYYKTYLTKFIKTSIETLKLQCARWLLENNSSFFSFNFIVYLFNLHSVIRVKMRESSNYAMCEMFRVTFYLLILWSFDLWHLDLYFITHTTVLLFILIFYYWLDIIPRIVLFLILLVTILNIVVDYIRLM